MKRVLLFGARDWDDSFCVGLVVQALTEAYGARNLLVIEGGAPGADTLAGAHAMARGVHVAEVQALWDSYGRSAGPRRNGVMRALQPSLGIGFHCDITQSKGTANMRDQLERAGIQHVIVNDRLKAMKLSRLLLRHAHRN